VGAGRGEHNSFQRSLPTPRQTFTREFKEAAVKSLGIDPKTLKYWLKKFPAATGAASPEESLRTEVRRLREENKRLLVEREILKKATAFFARQQP
jgi:transposase-like protein